MSHKLLGTIAAVNAAHAEALRLFPILSAIVAPWVGHKILKVDGTLLEKYRRQIPDLPNTPTLHVYRRSSDYNLIWMAKASGVTSGDPKGLHTVCYYECPIPVGVLDRGILDRVYPDAPAYRTDYTYHGVVALQAQYKAAQAEADRLANALCPFTP